MRLATLLARDAMRPVINWQVFHVVEVNITARPHAPEGNFQVRILSALDGIEQVKAEVAPLLREEPTDVAMRLVEGDAVAVDGVKLSPARLLERLNELGGANGIGPNLYATMGEPIGQGKAGFAFSDALKNVGGTTVTPDEAYRYGRGEPVPYMGGTVQRRWPLPRPHEPARQ